ncbi:isoprenylcysteine carboxylmethyltransferase family protein [Colwellia sp. 1_MG-2023]|uniref:methyltransferase family protein n=1 Tax=Colwellia sp. 1_MG-2023 TaxID=3062649 RepID=UPI0026E21508|nr:isoprenylcysteine carboxylmethyltransferase family protein [Colwellia sp. 1_MG-2023]MDO6444928.1 isoprenylcysteine carboxylmethyltransferase family protein [Colwellia sp. 1_MG-2023]
MMTKLELKVPPLLLVLIFATLMWLFQPFFQIKVYDPLVAQALFIFFECVGGLIILMGALAFKKAETTVNPTKPETTSSLVKMGIYHFTRNPMYLGMACCLIGWGFYLSNPNALVFILGFILYINRFQIKPEEKILTDMFQQEFIDYCTSVRRWL